MKAVINLMTPAHPKWNDFMVELEGPKGCRFRQKLVLGMRSPTWKCGGSIRRPICRRLLKKYKVDVAATLEFFRERGGCCDCEVIFNVERSFRRVKPVRKLVRRSPSKPRTVRARSNPKRRAR